jgi:hypothetical protein
MRDHCDKKLEEGLEAADSAIRYHNERLTALLDRLSTMPPFSSEDEDEDEDADEDADEVEDDIDALAPPPAAPLVAAPGS